MTGKRILDVSKQKWENNILKHEGDVRDRFLHIVLMSGIFAAIADTIAGSFTRASSPAFWPLILVNLVFASLFVITLAMPRRRKWTVPVLSATLNLFLFPLMFFLSGGMEGSGGIWIVIGIVAMFVLLSGKCLYAIAALTCAADMASYSLAYLHPEFVLPMPKEAAIADNCLSVLIVGFVLGILFKCSIALYEEERVKAKVKSEELGMASRARNTFFASMSHEIRTPINAIIGFNEMILREKDLSAEVVENASSIHNASKLLLTVINDILDAAKIESGKLEIVPVQYETGAMFSDLVNLLWLRIHDKRLEFKLDIDKNIPSMLYGDEVRLKQVIANLLTNAVKYTDKGCITLSVKSEPIDGNTARLRISVEDTGIGIRKENLKDLFSTFQRMDQEENRYIEGTGLGLSISKQLIELMGGQIVVDSVYKMGSVFTVIVEQQIVNDRPLGYIDFITKKRRDLVRYQQSFEAPDAHVLIVDDNEMNLVVAKKLLRDTKVQIDTASSGQECLRKTSARGYHVIFMDHVMPGMDGEETLREIRRQENGHCKDTPVIALTANAMSGAEQIYQEKGFEGYLAKPINGALYEATLLKFLPESLIEYRANAGEEDLNAVKVLSGRRKKKTGITTDCICDLPKKWLEQFEIRTMHYYVQTKNGRFCDLSEISSDNLMRYLKKEGNTASSEPPTTEEYENFFADTLHESETIIHISASAGISDGYGRAVEAAYSFDNVTVFDSRHLTSGLGILVLLAGKMSQDGQSAEDICRELAVLREKISTTFILDQESLYQNQRLHKRIQHLFCALQLYPILHISKGNIRLLSFKVGKKGQAYRQYIRMQLRHKKKIDKRILFIIHVGCSVEELNQIQEEISKIICFEYVQIQKASATVSANLGVGTFGLVFMRT